MYRDILKKLCFAFLPAMLNFHSAWACPGIDSQDVLSYDIQLFVDVRSQYISGSCAIQMSVLESDTLWLDLEGLQTDSVYASMGRAALRKVPFMHSNGKIYIPQTGGTWNGMVNIVVYYQGKPIKDETWGGFYFDGMYAWNMGVGFEAEPHNFGRVWFPCKDNFCDKALFSFDIETESDLKAVCNGEFVGKQYVAEGRTRWSYALAQPIPTYLASVAVAPYTEVVLPDNRGHRIRLNAEPADSASMLRSFIHLPQTIDHFIQHYGKHRFDIAGYHLVPFNAGAMEHATSIAYPRYAVQGGTLSYESLMAHELAHHWWGNNVTCADASEMWINEGWASYSERLFAEGIYGRNAYTKVVAANHKNVLHYAHLSDGMPLPVSGVAHKHTYGMHVYRKGADVIHSLRGIMGDTAFFKAVQDLMQSKEFGNVSTRELKSHFASFGNKVQIEQFFDDWISSPGFPHFSVYELRSVPRGNAWMVYLTIKQRLRHREHYYTHVPLTFKAMSSDGTFGVLQTTSIMGEMTSDSFLCPFKPVQIWIDPEERLSDAISDYLIELKSDSTWSSINPADDPGFMVLENPSANKKSNQIRLLHHWVSPDHYFNPNLGIVLSRERYFSIEGTLGAEDSYTLRFQYNGSTPAGNWAAGWLDNDLIRGSEDSLLIMYRPNQTASWEPYAEVDWIRGSLFDKRGTARIKNLRPGEYALAIKNSDFFSSAEEIIADHSKWRLFPNPAGSEIVMVCETTFDEGLLEITDIMGSIVHSEHISAGTAKISINSSAWASGVYFAGVLQGTHYSSQKFLVHRN